MSHLINKLLLITIIFKLMIILIKYKLYKFA